MRVRVLLDVDGVLNAVTGTPGDHWPDWNSEIAMGYRINFATGVADYVRELAKRADVIWLTTWADRANEWISPMLNLPQFTVLAGPNDGPSGWGGQHYGSSWWKLPPVVALWERDPVPFVWIDDDLKGSRSALQWLDGLPDGSFLALSPDTPEGIHPNHVEKIDLFLELHA